jgi:RNA polymerase-binding protein DksA
VELSFRAISAPGNRHPARGANGRNGPQEEGSQALPRHSVVEEEGDPAQCSADVERGHSFTFRLRGREKGFLQKIDHALEKIREGTFGVCEQCGEAISMKRLEARLETTLCIRCKEDQERIEKAYG